MASDFGHANGRKGGFMTELTRRGGSAVWFWATVVIVCLASSGQAQVVALGTSETAGEGVSLYDAYPAQLESMLRAKGYDVHVANAGVTGDTPSGMLTRLDSAVAQGTRVVVLQPGGDVARHGLAGRQGDIAQMVSRLASRQIKVVMIENSMIALIPARMRQPGLIHLSPEGHRLLASRVLPEVIRALKSK
jgi:acyl-CoA thioesterase I